MKILIVLILSASLWANTEKPFDHFYLYAHPVSLGVGYKRFNDLYLHATLEVPVSGRYSALIMPRYYQNEEGWRAGLTSDIRYYPRQKAEGLYGFASLAFSKYNRDHHDDMIIVSYVGGGGLTLKWRRFAVFTQLGLGIANVTPNSYDYYGDLATWPYTTNFDFDARFGIGIGL